MIENSKLAHPNCTCLYKSTASKFVH